MLAHATLNESQRERGPHMDEQQRVEHAYKVSDPDSLAALALDNVERIRVAVAHNRHTASEILEVLARDSSPDVRSAVALRPDTPAQTLLALAADSNGMVRARVSWNSACPDELLERFAADSDSDVRYGVAKNPRASATLLVQLASDAKGHVRGAVARNAAASHSALTALASDEDAAIRATVARHPQCPLEVLDRLAADPKWQVRVAVAESAAKRADCPPDLLRLLARDRTKSVKAAVAQRPDLPPDIALALSADGFVSDGAIGDVKESDHISAEEILALKSAKQRAKLVSQSSSPQVLTACASDSSTTVRMAVVKNPCAPDAAVSTVLRLCQGNVWVGINATIVYEAVQHPNVSEETLIQAASLANGTNLAALLQREPPISFNLYIAVIALEVGSTFLRAADRSLKKRCIEFTEEQWRLAAEYEDKQVRQLVAMNPSTPEHLLSQLALDPDEDVRKAVIQNRSAPATARASAALLEES